MSYTIRSFDAANSRIVVEYESGKFANVLLPLDNKGNVPTGENLDHLIKGMEPRDPVALTIQNADDIHALVVPSPEVSVEVSNEAEWRRVRDIRAYLLSQSDFAVVADSPVSEEDRAVWLTYRQALRDITDVSDPYSVEWPARPDGKEVVAAEAFARTFGAPAVKKKRTRKTT